MSSKCKEMTEILMFMTYLQEIVHLFRYEKMTYLVAVKR